MLLTMADLEELIKKFPEIGDLDIKNIPVLELLQYIYQKTHHKIIPEGLDKDFLEYLGLNLEPENEKIIINYLKSFIVFSKLSSKENAYYFQMINQVNEFNKFQKESTTRINKLKKELSGKYPEFNDLINAKFNNLINELENEFNSFSPMVAQVNNIKYDGKNILSDFKAKKGRPVNALFNSFLVEINDLAEELYPDKKFAMLIKPFFTYVAKRFPDILDEDDVNNTEKLRKNIARLKSSNKKNGGK